MDWLTAVDRFGDKIGFVVWSIIFGLISTIFTPATRTKFAWFMAFIVAVPIGYLAGELGTDMGLSKGWVNLTVAISALLAQHMIVGLIAIGEWFSANSASIFSKLVDSYLNGKKKK